MDNSEIVTLIEGYEKEIKSIKNNALRMVWYMRGGITYDDAMLLSDDERTMINNLIKENLETTKKSGMPFF